MEDVEHDAEKKWRFTIIGGEDLEIHAEYRQADREETLPGKLSLVVIHSSALADSDYWVLDSRAMENEMENIWPGSLIKGERR